MNSIVQLLLIAAFAGDVATVTTLDGKSLHGEVSSLDGETLQIVTDSGPESLAVDQLMLLEFSRENSTPPVQQLVLSDGSQFSFEMLKADGQSVSIGSATLGDVQIDRSQLVVVRWNEVDAKVAESWADLLRRGARDDLLVIRKGDVLDYVGGTLARIDENGVTLTVRGRDLVAPKDKVFGVILANRQKTEKPPLGRVKTISGDELNAVALKLTDGKLVATTEILPEMQLNLETIREIDFGGGRIRFLADLPYDDSQSVNPDERFPVVWFTAKNFPAGTGGRRPLKIDGQNYSRGLWIHSGGVVRFRLNRQFSEFRAIAGFDQTHLNNMPRFDPQVKFVIMGDERELYSHEFLWNDPAENVRVDLSDVRELVIQVQSQGQFKGILEHFALGDAQVIK